MFWLIAIGCFVALFIINRLQPRPKRNATVAQDVVALTLCVLFFVAMYIGGHP